MKPKGLNVPAKMIQHIQVEVDPHEAIKALKADFLTGINVRSHAFIKDGKWTVTDEYHTSHSWTEDTVLREATPGEIQVFQAFQTIREYLVNRDQLRNTPPSLRNPEKTNP